MSNESLMSYLKFNAGLQDYATPVAFKDADRSAFDFDDVSSEKTDDKKNFSCFMESLKESNNAKKDTETNISSSTDENSNDGVDTGKNTKASDKTEGEVKETTQSTMAEGQSVDTALSSSLPAERIVISQCERIQLSALPRILDGTDAADGSRVTTVTSESIGETLSMISEKLQALIDALTGQNSGVDSDEVESANTSGDTSVLSVQGTEDTEIVGSLFELLGALIGQIDRNTDNDGEYVIQRIFAQLQGDEHADLSVVLSGLSSEDMTELKDQINAYLTGELSLEEQENLAGLLAQYYPAALSPAPQIMVVADTPALSNVIVASDSSSLGIVPKANDSLPAPDSTGSNRSGAANENMSAKDVDSASEQPRKESSLKANMDGENTKDTVNVKTQKGSSSTGAGERFLQVDSAGQIAVSAEGDTAFSSQIALGTSVIQTQSSMMSSAGMQAQSAGHAHPATQMVSMTMQKAIKAGEETTIRLQLDPPELGRVEVKMSIDQDNTAKIVLTAEKAETHQMLQRNAQFLEQAMSDAGLDAQGNLSFELASDGQAFEKSNSSEDHAGSGSDANAESEATVQISTMDWYVDPNTGRTHYSILA